MNNFRSTNIVTNEMKFPWKTQLQKLVQEEIESLNSLKSSKEIEFTI